jgi:hypothetical protein
MAAGSKRSSTWAPSLNTVVFTPDWKSNDTAFGSGGERAGQGLLGPLGAGGAPEARSASEAKVRWA